MCREEGSCWKRSQTLASPCSRDQPVQACGGVCAGEEQESIRCSAVGPGDAGDMAEGQGAPAAASSSQLCARLGEGQAACKVSCRCSASGVTCQSWNRQPPMQPTAFSGFMVMRSKEGVPVSHAALPRTSCSREHRLQAVMAAVPSGHPLAGDGALSEIWGPAAQLQCQAKIISDPAKGRPRIAVHCRTTAVGSCIGRPG